MPRFLMPVISRYASVVVQFLVVAAVTRSLDRDDAGQYFVIMGLVLATYFVAGVGLPDGIVRFAPSLVAAGRSDQAEALLHKGFRFSLATVPVGAALCWCAVAVDIGAGCAAVLAALWWASYGIIFVSAQLIVAGGRSELGTALFYSAANTGQLLITVPLILFAHFDRLDSVLFATVAGTAAAAVVAFVIAWRHCKRCEADALPLQEAWKQGSAIAAGRVVQSCLLWSPVWVVNVTLGASDAALVGLASRLVSAVAAALAAVRFAIRPSLARAATIGDWPGIERDSSQIALFTTSLAVGAIAVAGLVGEPLIALVFGPDYRGAGLITTLMLIGTVGESFGGPVDEVLKMAGHARDVLIVQTAALLGGVGAQFVAARTGGVSVQVVTYGLTFVVLYLVLIARLWRVRRILVVPRFARRS